MTTSLRHLAFEIKSVSPDRVIEGWAAVADNIDRVDDIIDPAAFTKTLSEKPPAQIGVFIGHDMSGLPMGVPLDVRFDGKGLYTKTLIKPTPAGDELLATARFLQDHGQPLGMSIGYKTRDAKYERREGKTVRRLLDIDLIEYSYAANQAIANPEALVSAVKTALAEKAMSEGSDAAGGFAVPADRARKAELDTDARDALDDSDFAYIDSEGGRHLPINDAAHVRAAVARFNQQQFERESDKPKAWKRVVAAAKREGIEMSDESMPKTNGDAPEAKAGPEHMAALRKLLSAHRDAASAHQKAHDAHGAALSKLKDYQGAVKGGDFGGGDDSDSDGDDDGDKTSRRSSERKASADHLKAMRGVVRAHQDAMSAHQDAMDSHAAAMEETKSYQAKIKNGDFDGDGDNLPVPDEKTVLRWMLHYSLIASERKAGKRHSAADSRLIQQVHDVSKSLGAECDDGTDEGVGSARDMGVGDSKTLDGYQARLTALH